MDFNTAVFVFRLDSPFYIADEIYNVSWFGSRNSWLQNSYQLYIYLEYMDFFR